MMGIESASYDAIELLSGKRETKHLHRALPFTTQVDGKGAVIWKIKR
jgi:hypothetical protein